MEVEVMSFKRGRVLVSRVSESGVEVSRVRESGVEVARVSESRVDILSERNILFLIKNNLIFTYEICS